MNRRLIEAAAWQRVTSPPKQSYGRFPTCRRGERFALSVTGGFWSLINVVKTPGAATLYISYRGNLFFRLTHP